MLWWQLNSCIRGFQIRAFEHSYIRVPIAIGIVASDSRFSLVELPAQAAGQATEFRKGSGIQPIQCRALFAPALGYDQHGIDQDFEIHSQGHIFDIEDIEFQAFHHLIHIFGIAIFYLAP